MLPLMAHAPILRHLILSTICPTLGLAGSYPLLGWYLTTGEGKWPIS